MSLKLADSKVIDALLHMVNLIIMFGTHTSEDWHWVTDIIGFDIIVGQPWLEKHDPVIRWNERSMTFKSDYYRQ